MGFQKPDRYLLFIMFVTVFFLGAGAQNKPDSVRVLLDNIAELQEGISGDTEIDDEEWFDDVIPVKELVKVNINTADRSTLKKLQFLSGDQIQSFLEYKQSFGNLIDMYELQSVPLWDISTIIKVLPLIKITAEVDMLAAMKEGIKNSQSNLMIRGGQKIMAKDLTYSENFSGSPMRLSIKYKNLMGSALQYGFVADKDAGEQLFRGTQKKGFDFYSFHAFIKNKGVIKSLALGDYTVNMGQGLICWQTMAFKKTASILMLKRQSPMIKPYCSFAENNFERGVAIALEKNKNSATIFCSKRNLDAHLLGDSIPINHTGFTSIQISGLHRTSGEIEQKNKLSLYRLGGCLSRNFKYGKIAVNALSSVFDSPKLKTDQPENLFSFEGKRIQNYGVDFTVTKNNKYAFGEIAASGSGRYAQLYGLLLSISPKVDFGFLLRNISKNYWSYGANAVTENQGPVNEKGTLMELSVKLNDYAQFSAFADYNQFPWLTNAVNTVAYGKDFCVFFDTKRKLYAYQIRFRLKQKMEKDNQSSEAICPAIISNDFSFRTQISKQLSNEMKLQTRIEIHTISRNDFPSKQGVLFSSALSYKKPLSPFSINFQLILFETEDYASRIYHYDNDVSFNSSFVEYYGKGHCLSFRAKEKISRMIDVELKYAYSIHYSMQNASNSTISEKIQEIKVQITSHF